ncbi:coatomer alpha subunit, putative [Trypanosoma brucei gambiense DAL972]|uniref:Coatomer subunit alpha n=1 Tax=Trypanosoma brucei gambiense (strain MHOM/CI/86/DAL972) TaxID=679716 RepID=C9ZLN9_TRYB9|nr:coatomer alpha subunit, putative [Trypanosoma brucei gambiense DAL972]CBH10314.1 coatomer alpha subunit, putative [Trypanosoma brucei gambiense DAL972]|eukprot:XP_011772604.1 coatomer alpha subunit, putative [Trypanosoma brucei gambiense DAL972]
MLTRFDVRSSRVKGISFHKTRPWVLCGLHNGTVQIWDYRVNTSVDKYDEHSGAVRGVDFHDTQPLFVSGGDDYLVKVWNYKARRSLFTLKGHMDYVRSTFFHHEQPWIVSSSDDFTVRIWNWQNRSSLACLPGHTHYVMCARFHPRDDIVVSASLDRTIRVWDISSLRVRKQQPGIAQDLLGTSDVGLKYSLEGHDKGVNWVCFHPTQPLIASASDDRTVRVWRIGSTTCTEEVQLRGHTNNVSCVVYTKDYLVSNGEDRTIRVWDVKTRCSVMLFRRESDRYWMLAALLEKNLLAAGHDSGVHVFKLFRERPASTMNGNVLHYVHGNVLHSYNMESKTESKFSLSRNLHPPLTLSCNPVDNMAVVFYDKDGGCASTLTIPKPGCTVDADVKKRLGILAALFYAPNKCAFLDKNKNIILCNAHGDGEKVIKHEKNLKALFPGPAGYILRQTEEGMELFHVAQQSVAAEVPITETKYVVWDKDFTKVAFLGITTVHVMTRRLRSITFFSEPSIRIKSAAFDEQRNILYYTTSDHLKYCNLRNGECGIIQCLPSPIYLVRASGDTVWALSRNGKVVVMELNNPELNFKLKLQQQAYRDVIKIIRQKQLRGQALVGYLHKHGHDEVALYLVSDPLTRFNLAVECGAMDVAKTAALELNQPALWRRLAEAATSYGDIHLALLAHTKTGNFHGASFLSLITGNMSALDHMVNTVRDENFGLHYGMYLDDAHQRIKTLTNTGQLPLAYVAAKSAGLDELAASLLEKMDPDVAERMRQTEVKVRLEAPTVTPVTDNWPMLQVEESVFSRFLREPNLLSGAGVGIEEEEYAEAGAGWDDVDGLPNSDDGSGGLDGVEGSEAAEGDGWGDDLEIEIPAEQTAGGVEGAPYVVPTERPPLTQHWVETSSFPAFHVAAGSFSTALGLLRRQIGLGDPAPLKTHMLDLWATVNASRPSWLIPSAMFPLTTYPSEEQRGAASHSPLLPDYIPQLTERLRSGYSAFVGGHFADAQLHFVTALHQAVFTTCRGEKQFTALREIVTTASEYARALNVQLHCRSTDGASKLSLELSLYFTHFKLQRNHLALALGQAMSKAYKLKNLKIAASVARRLLDQDPPKQKAAQASAIVAEAERNPTDAEPVDYDERNPFVLCSVSHRPMYKGTVDPIRCGYCFSPAMPKHKGEICPVCRIAFLGADCSGLANRT